MKSFWKTGFALSALAALVAGLTLAAEQTPIRFHDVTAQTAEFMGYHRTIELTLEQRAVMKEALLPLAAPCCKDKSAYTCCCECNMGRSWWGLSKHLIVDRGMGAEEVRETVSEWLDFIHPNGAAGDSCYSGRCNLPFNQDGCGGMRPDRVVF